MTLSLNNEGLMLGDPPSFIHNVCRLISEKRSRILAFISFPQADYIRFTTQNVISHQG